VFTALHKPPSWLQGEGPPKKGKKRKERNGRSEGGIKRKPEESRKGMEGTNKEAERRGEGMEGEMEGGRMDIPNI